MLLTALLIFGLIASFLLTFYDMGKYPHAKILDVFLVNLFIMEIGLFALYCLITGGDSEHG